MLNIPLFDLVQQDRTGLQCGSYQLPVLLMYVCSCWCNPYVSENVEHSAAQISRFEALGQSRSKSSFARIGRDAMIG